MKIRTKFNLHDTFWCCEGIYEQSGELYIVKGEVLGYQVYDNEACHRIEISYVVKTEGSNCELNKRESDMYSSEEECRNDKNAWWNRMGEDDNKE